ncbi:MAG: lipid carrier : UDP-N-acetylgalactosaminyltransferase [Segetibacter sp.]|jgi:lipopolysaccharide/colanic/teichoic acid biosynthesis glycosyltransferase|nr:lipid carrier : UDP-N-acetylgalactosaminyltransferase [Segetibacter sp.]
MYLIAKRGIDILLAVFVLLVTLPVIVVLMFLLKFTGDGEVFYLQERVGYKNRRFFIWKFATMSRNADKIGSGEFTVKNDPRLIPMGKFLRKSKLNELPQIFNILKGDMTLVGPRPLIPTAFNRYSKEVQRKIYNVKPGITGIGSVIFRDEEVLVSKCTDFEQLYRQINGYKGKLEMWYQQNVGFRTDFLIIFLTAYSILIPKQQLTFHLFKNLPNGESNQLDFGVKKKTAEKVSEEQGIMRGQKPMLY